MSRGAPTMTRDWTQEAWKLIAHPEEYPDLVGALALNLRSAYETGCAEATAEERARVVSWCVEICHEDGFHAIASRIERAFLEGDEC